MLARHPAAAPRSILRPVALFALGALAVVMLGSLGLGSLLPSLGNPFRESTIDRPNPALLESLQDVSRHTGATGSFQVLVDLEKDTKYVPSFLKGERTVFLAAGSVDAYVDFSTIGEDAVTIRDDGSVLVVLPPAELTDVRIDTEASYVMERDRGLVDRIGGVFSDQPVSDRDLYRVGADKLAAAAAESDLQARAEANTRTMVTDLLASLGHDDVTVRFEVPPALVAP